MVVVVGVVVVVEDVGVDVVGVVVEIVDVVDGSHENNPITADCAMSVRMEVIVVLLDSTNANNPTINCGMLMWDGIMGQDDEDWVVVLFVANVTKE